MKPQIFAVTRKITIPINLIGQGVMDRLQVSALDQLPITPTEPYLVRCRSFYSASSCLFLQLNVNDTSWLVTALTGNQSVCERSVINLCLCAVCFLGHFMYTEVSPSSITQGSKARLLSPRYPATRGSCLQFWYHMYGQTIGTLNVYTRRSSWSLNKVWSKTGNDTNIWNVAQVTIRSPFAYQVCLWS